MTRPKLPLEGYLKRHRLTHRATDWPTDGIWGDESENVLPNNAVNMCRIWVWVWEVVPEVVKFRERKVHVLCLGEVQLSVCASEIWVPVSLRAQCWAALSSPVSHDRYLNLLPSIFMYSKKICWEWVSTRFHFLFCNFFNFFSYSEQTWQCLFCHLIPLLGTTSASSFRMSQAKFHQ